MTTITDPRTRLLLLAELIRNPEGLTAEQAQTLRGLSAADLVKLAEMREPRLVVSTDGNGIDMALRRTIAITAHDAQLEALLMGGATVTMIRRLFPAISTVQATDLRKRLGAPAGRRPKMPTNSEREAIAVWWWNRTKGKDSIDAFIELRVAFPLWSYGSLYAVVHENDEKGETKIAVRLVA